MSKVMENIQVRIPTEDCTELEELSKQLHTSRSEAARNALHKGIRMLKMEIARKRYLDGGYSLTKAAEFAGVSVQEMAEYLSKAGIPYYRYNEKELARDAEKVEDWVGDD